MTFKLPSIAGCLTVGILLIGIPSFANPAVAQGTSALGGVGESQTITERVTVQSVNQQTRQIVLAKPNGEEFTVHAGDAVRNLAQIKPGQTVAIRYYSSVTHILSKPGANVPANSRSIAAARAKKGERPGGAIAETTTVTGTVVSVDLAGHKLQLVNPKGGRVFTIDVTNPQRQKELATVSVGDSLTTVITEALAIDVEPVM